MLDKYLELCYNEVRKLKSDKKQWGFKMKMTMDEFVERQREFKGYKVRFKAKRKDGNINYFERIVNDRFCNPSGNFFEVLEVEILNHIGITTMTIGQNGIGLKTKF